MNRTSYTYGQLGKLNRVFLIALSFIFLVIGLFFFAEAISEWLKSEQKLSVLNLLGYFFACSVWSPLILLFVAHLFCDVSIDDDGLHTKFLFITYDLKWEDIAEVKTAKFFSLPMLKEATLVVATNGLTPFHRLYGMVYGKTSQPSLSISLYIREYAVLKKEIYNRLKKKRQAKK